MKFFNKTLLGLWALNVGVIAIAAPEHAVYGGDEIQAPTVELIKVEELTPQEEQELLGQTIESESRKSETLPPLEASDLILDQIVNMGKKIWAIVESGRPSVNIKTDVASALPEGVLHWGQLEGWKMPKVYTYRVVYKNKFGIETVNFSYRITQTYGGGYKGVGQYLARVAIVPDQVKVAWGYSFNATASVPLVFNSSTSESPVGAAEMMIDWEVKTATQYHRQSELYYLDGTGAMSVLSQ